MSYSFGNKGGIIKKKLIEGRSKSIDSKEWHSTPVSVTHITGDSSRSPLIFAECIELKIGQGKRSRIVQLQPEASYQLAYKLIENARTVEVNIAEDNAYYKGIEVGYKQRDREERIEKRQGNKKTVN
jgi:hypothetical protein